MGARAMQVMRRTVRPVSGEQSGGGGGQSGRESACVIRPLNQWKVGPVWTWPGHPRGPRNPGLGALHSLTVPLQPSLGGARGGCPAHTP